MFIIRVLSAFAMLAIALGGPVGAAPATESLSIATASGNHRFEVEVMRRRPELEKGLMFRKTMAADHGMLFDFGRPQNVSMWMKNTYLPLDMLFIGGDGRVVNVARDAVPMTETIIPSGGPIVGVLELNAGVADRIGVKAGDRVTASIFGKPADK